MVPNPATSLWRKDSRKSLSPSQHSTCVSILLNLSCVMFNLRQCQLCNYASNYCMLLFKKHSELNCFCIVSSFCYYSSLYFIFLCLSALIAVLVLLQHLTSLSVNQSRLILCETSDKQQTAYFCAVCVLTLVCWYPWTWLQTQRPGFQPLQRAAARLCRNLQRHKGPLGCSSRLMQRGWAI